MKKFNFAKIVSLVFVCAMLLCALAVTALAQDETTVEIVSNNVYFGEKYQLMYAVNAPAGAKVSATVNGEAVGVHAFADEQGKTTATVNGKECTMYILDEGVAAQAIDTVVTFTVEAGGKTATSNYSVLQYVYERTHGISENQAEGKELAMLEAFLAFADAANAHFDGATVSFNDYKYVTVVNGTLDGNNTAGIFAPGATPFANIEATLDYDNTAYNVEWDVSVDGAEAVRYNSEAIKTVEVNGNMTVTRVLVESECKHVWDDGVVKTPATCTVTGVLVKTCTLGCGETTEEEIPVIAHNFVDGKCSVCGESDPAYKGYSGRYYIATKRSDGNYFYMTNDLGTASTKRYQAVDSGLTALPESINNPESNKIFVIEMNEDGTTYSIYAEGISEVNKYLGWTSGNSGALVEKANAKAFTITLGEDNTYNIYFDDRYLSLNGTSGNNYFAFYTGTQKQDLVLIPILECEHTNTEDVAAVEATCTTAGNTAGTRCIDCNQVVTGVEVIPATGHTEVVVPGKAATCAEDGLTDGTKCSVCGEVLVPQETINATGEHNDGDGNGFCDVCNADMNSDEAKAEQVLAGITGPADVTEAGTVELDTAHDTGYEAQVNWAITGGTNTVSNVSGNVLTVVLGSSETTLELTVTVTVGEKTATASYEIKVAAGKKEPTIAFEITGSDFNSTSYAANNNEKTENGYAYTSYQVMLQSGAMQWQKSKGYITTSASGIVKIEMTVTSGTFTVTVGGTTVTGTTANGVTTYDLTGKSGEIKIAVGSATGKVTSIKFYK